MDKIKAILNKLPKHICFLLIVSIALFIPAFKNGGIYGDDANFHVVNVIAMSRNSSFFDLPTRIRPLTAYNFGYGTGIFYPQLIHMSMLYSWRILQIFGVSVDVAIICFLATFTFVTSLFMRKLLYKYTANSFVSSLGAAFYITYPYYVTDIYSRSAYGELISFLAMPIIFLGIHYLLTEQDKFKFYIHFVAGFYLLFASHLISTVYVTIYTGIFLLCQGKKLFKKDVLLPFVFATLITIVMSLDFFIPIFEHKLGAEYMVFQEGHMYTRENVIFHTVRLDCLLRLNSRLATFIPSFTMVLIVFMLFKIKKLIKLVDGKIVLGMSVFFAVAVLLTTVPAIWKVAPSFLLMIQFAWRNCGYICFSGCILASFSLMLFPEKRREEFAIICLLLTMAALNFVFYYRYHTPDTRRPFSYWESGLGAQKEYLPKNTYDNLDYFKERNHDIKVVEGEGTFEILRNNTPDLRFSVSTPKEVVVEIPRLYYLWYKVELVDEQNNVEVIEFYENDKGFIEFAIPRSGEVRVVYEKTLLSKIVGIVSFVSLGIFVGVICIVAVQKRRKSDVTRNHIVHM